MKLDVQFVVCTGIGQCCKHWGYFKHEQCVSSRGGLEN